MAQTPTKPEEFDYEDGKGDIRAAMQFLIDARNYVAQIEIPKGRPYMQMPHSDDTKIVGDDGKKPAILDASYIYFERPYLSISLPDFTPTQEMLTIIPRKITPWDKLRKAFNPNAKIITENYKINTGFTSGNLQDAFLTLLKHYGIEVKSGSTKIGHDRVSGTAYFESILQDPRDYEKGRKIIQAYVHGEAETPEELTRDIQRALPKGRAPTLNL